MPATGRQERSKRDPQPRPHGSFGENEFGFADFGGDIWEWTSTCHRRVHLYSCGSVGSSEAIWICDVYVTRRVAAAWPTRAASLHEQWRDRGNLRKDKYFDETETVVDLEQRPAGAAPVTLFRCNLEGA